MNLEYRYTVGNNHTTEQYTFVSIEPDYDATIWITVKEQNEPLHAHGIFTEKGKLIAHYVARPDTYY